MKILVPADFSRLSEVAVRYACGMAKKLKAQIVLLHVVHFSGPPRGAVTIKVKALEERMADDARQDSILLLNKLKKEFKGVKITYEIVAGYPVERVIQIYAKRNDVDLIIMGTKGASGLQKVLIGSNAVAVINNSKLPVMTIPEHARFGKGIKRIVYASDLKRINAELKYLVPFARIFGASVHLLHVVPTHSGSDVSVAQIRKQIGGKHGSTKITVRIMMDDDVMDGIDQCVADVKADMLAMFTRNLTLLDRLFDRSITRRTAFHTWIPLLTIKK
ncbi:MAG: universal stress protein [Bacteroidetes bacterium]|nr:universal stress protein [Bacteroidota bacterium]